MASISHTFGPTCVLHRTKDVPSETSDPPEVDAQFFYEKKVPIDDPLSPLPPIPSESRSTPSKHPPQPFSARDNAALEEAWSTYRKEVVSLRESRRISQGRRSRSQDKNLTRGDDSSPFTKEKQERAHDVDETERPNHAPDLSGRVKKQSVDARKLSSVSNEAGRPRDRKSLTHTLNDEPDVMLADEPSTRAESEQPLNQEELDRSGRSEIQDSWSRRRQSPFHHRSKSRSRRRKESLEASAQSILSSEPQSENAALSSSVENSRISGRPFARVPSRRWRDRLDGTQDEALTESLTHPFATSDGLPVRDRSNSTVVTGEPENASQAFVPVGISRLHLVEIPDLVMKPIYWSPINDISSVNRATWFYKSTMLPLDPELANQLEIGYEYMRPWTQTWQDELDSCVDIGAAAELKVAYRIWPKKDERKPSTPLSTGNEVKPSGIPHDSEVPSPPRPKFDVNTAAGGSYKDVEDGPRPFRNHSVIFVNATEAQILRPSLLPSSSRGRRPLNAIRKGRQIGVAVVRGFDSEAWHKLYPPDKMTARVAQAKVGAYLSQSGDAATRERRSSCTACRIEEDRPTPTDLVLVIHGIGQKLSQRVDSFHFTHAINAFRREINIELSSDAVQGSLRQDMGGIMVLPINWRLTLSFDDANTDDEDTVHPADKQFHLKDITPETLPAVRNVISDVMLDIPYYLSNHKQKMTTAVIKEANRVYRLWCKNNPNFRKNGRVHLIAHSLGAAMTMDILSQQPTKPPSLSSSVGKNMSESHFEFDTKSLFCCGSPAGFFLLLNRAKLLPRKGRNKPESNGEDFGKGIAGEAGTYGCLAVDNIYNVMHYNDPIAYHVNAAVDVDYAASLKEARIPSATPGFFAGLPNPFRWGNETNPSEPVPDAFGVTNRPNITKLPSTIELDTHNFSREEIAEKRMFLLNDNGQIDYFVSSGGGPLEIQYLSMLSAHSSYWTLKDFIRFLVLEIGRKRGRSGTLVPLRAEKRRIIKAGKIA
ncbi:MAG: hypothetical protein Q9227_005854 [Pyrenula ochraceoflavens]